MRCLPVTFLAAACVFLSAAVVGSAQNSPVADATPEINVRNVKFAYPRVDGSQGPAMEAEVELDVRGSTVAGRNPRFVDNVRVTLMLAIQVRGRAAGEFQYYHAEAAAVTLEAGTRAMRFYLPAEIVERDGIGGDPYAYYVEVAVGERVLPPQRGNVSDALRARERFEVFLQKVTEARPANDGILLPQHLFLSGFRDGRETPAVFRKGGR